MIQHRLRRTTERLGCADGADVPGTTGPGRPGAAPVPRTLLNTMLLAALLLAGRAGTAQVAAVQIGVDGLTCSQCTRNVEMQLRRLPFVAAVRMNLEHTNGDIQLQEGRAFSPERVAAAVRDAGFSLRYLTVVVAHPAPYRQAPGCFAVPGLGVQVVGDVPEVLPDTVRLRLLGAPFGPKKAAPAPAARRCPGSRYFATVVPEEIL